MKILSEEIVSSTDIIKNYTSCREKTKELGKTFIFKNNSPDMVLMDIEEYERVFEKIYNLIDEIEHIDIYNMIQERKSRDTGVRHTFEEVMEMAKSRT